MRIGLILFASVLTLTVVTGCSSFKSDSDKIKVGVDLPLSGAFAAYGKEIVKGMELYRKEAAARGIDIELIVIDNNSNAAKAQEAFKTLVEKHHVQVVVGDYSSANTLVLKPLALKYRIPVVSPTATNDEVTSRNPYMFRTCFNDSFQGKAIAWYLRHKTGINSVGILINLDLEGGDYSRGLARSMAAAFEKSGGKVAKEVGYRSGQKDFTSVIKELQAAGVQGVFAPLYANDATSLIAAAAKNNFTPVLIGGDGWAETEVLYRYNPRAIGSFYACMFADEHTSSATLAFSALLEQEKMTPGMCLAQGYDTIGIIALVTKPGMTGDEVKTALGKVVNYPGVTGNTTIGADGNATKQVFIKQIYRDKNLHHLEDRVIYVVNPDEIKF